MPVSPETKAIDDDLKQTKKALAAELKLLLLGETRRARAGRSSDPGFLVFCDFFFPSPCPCVSCREAWGSAACGRTREYGQSLFCRLLDRCPAPHVTVFRSFFSFAWSLAEKADRKTSSPHGRVCREDSEGSWRSFVATSQRLFFFFWSSKVGFV